MAMSVSILAVITSVHLIAFVFAIGAEFRRSKSKLVPDQYDERTYCVYDSDASTIYALSAFALLLISQALVNAVTRCFCCGGGRDRIVGIINGGGGAVTNSSSSKLLPLIFFVFSWVSFLGAEACLLGGSVRNAYHTKYRGWFGAGEEISCATLRKGVFSAGASLSILSMVGSILYYWAYTRADTAGWQKHHNEGLGMTAAFPFHHDNATTTKAAETI